MLSKILILIEFNIIITKYVCLLVCLVQYNNYYFYVKMKSNVVLLLEKKKLFSIHILDYEICKQLWDRTPELVRTKHCGSDVGNHILWNRK